MVVLGGNRLLDEHRLELLERRRQSAGHRLRGAAVEIQRDVDLGADGVADRADDFARFFDGCRRIDDLESARRNQLHGGVARFDVLARLVGGRGRRIRHVVGAVSPDVLVESTRSRAGPPSSS